MSYMIAINPIIEDPLLNQYVCQAKFCKDTNCWNGSPSWDQTIVFSPGLNVILVNQDIWRIFLQQNVNSNQEWKLAKVAVFEDRILDESCVGNGFTKYIEKLGTGVKTIDKKTGFISDPVGAALPLGPVFSDTFKNCGYIKWTQINADGTENLFQLSV